MWNPVETRGGAGMPEETVSIRIDRVTRQLLRMLAARWDVSLTEALRRVVTERAGEEGVELPDRP